MKARRCLFCSFLLFCSVGIGSAIGIGVYFAAAPPEPSPPLRQLPPGIPSPSLPPPPSPPLSPPPSPPPLSPPRSPEYAFQQSARRNCSSLGQGFRDPTSNECSDWTNSPHYANQSTAYTYETIEVSDEFYGVWRNNFPPHCIILNNNTFGERTSTGGQLGVGNCSSTTSDSTSRWCICYKPGDPN